MSGYYSDEHGGGDYGDIRHSYEHAKENSINMLASLGTVHQDKNGEYSWMGIKLDRDIAFLLQQTTSGLPTLIGEKLGNGVYENASKVYTSLSKQLGKAEPNKLQSHKFGLASSAAATALLIGLQPIVTVTQSFKDRNNKRSAIRKDIQSVIEIDNHYKDNEVVKTALERTQKIVSAGFKNAAGQLPTVLTNGYFAWGNHKVLAKDRLDIVNGVPLNASSPRSFNVDEKTQQFMGIGALAGNIILQRKIFKDSDEDLSKPIAYNLIMDLKRNIDAGNVYKGTDISQQIIEIFQQNEVDRGRVAVGPALMDKLSPLAKRIGEIISNRELDPISLLDFVGKGNVIKKDTNGNRRFITTEQLEAVIEEERKKFGNREKAPMEELLANFTNPKIVMQSIKDNLKTLEGDDKAIFAALFSDEVLLKSGVKKKELPEIRTRNCDITCEFIKSIAVEMAQKSPEELKAKNISEEEIVAVKKFNDLVNSGDKKTIDSAVRSTDEDGTNQIRKAVLSYGLNDKNPNFWRDAIGKTKEQHKKEATTSMTEAIKDKSGRENGVTLGV